jgi:predicted dehydrogenase
MAKPFPQRPLRGGRTVETWDIASILLELEGGVTGLLALNRSAWGRKGRLALQIFGSGGTIVYDQERMNEFSIYRATGATHTDGFTTILTGPAHEPYGRFVPAPGHGLGFNDLKVIEAHEVLAAIAGQPARIIDFAAGLEIERAVHAMAHSHHTGQWTPV